MKERICIDATDCEGLLTQGKSYTVLADGGDANVSKVFRFRIKIIDDSGEEGWWFEERFSDN